MSDYKKQAADALKCSMAIAQHFVIFRGGCLSDQCDRTLMAACSQAPRLICVILFVLMALHIDFLEIEPWKLFQY